MAEGSVENAKCIPFKTKRTPKKTRPIKDVCPNCGGTGLLDRPSGSLSYGDPRYGDPDPMDSCPCCGGTGMQHVSEYTGDSTVSSAFVILFIFICLVLMWAVFTVTGPV